MSLLSRSFSWATWTGAVIVCGACGSSGDETAGPAMSSHGGSGGVDGSAIGGSGGSSLETGVGGITVGCQPACVTPQLCSAANKCIDPGTCGANADCTAGMVCDIPTNKCVPGGDCGSEELAADPVPPNLLVVLDRSCSMKTAVSGGKSKWELSVKALDLVIANSKTKLRFGMVLFPDLTKPDCGESKIPIPVSDQGGDAITALLDNTLVTKATKDWYPGDPCVTPIDSALKLAATEAAFADLTRQSYVLLVSDGKQTACGTTVAAREAAGISTIAALLKDKKVPTFVLGFGSEVDPVQLDACAVAGGVPNTGATKYYDAQDAASLDAALKAIADKASLSCTLELKTTPPDPDKVFVFYNKTIEAVRDTTHVNGWDYDPGTNRIVFYGQACEDLKNGNVSHVDVVFGCKKPPVN